MSTQQQTPIGQDRQTLDDILGPMKPCCGHRGDGHRQGAGIFIDPCPALAEQPAPAVDPPST